MVAGPGARIAARKNAGPQADKSDAQDRTRRFTNDAVQIGPEARDCAAIVSAAHDYQIRGFLDGGPPNTLRYVVADNTDDAGGAVLLRDITGVCAGFWQLRRRDV